MKKRSLKYWGALLLGVLLTSCNEGELEGDLYPVSPDKDNGLEFPDNGGGGNGDFSEITLKGIEFVYVKRGSFYMGATSEQMENAYKDELPLRTVTLTKDYYIGKYEVTQQQWKVLMGDAPSYNNIGGKYPVENVSWNNVQQFISKLNASSRVKFRLPTEAEWEYAARGGQVGGKYNYSGSNNIEEIAWYENNSSDHTHQVGGKTPNALGIFDMSGNVYEWCNDWYGPYQEWETKDPQGNYFSDKKVLRGGCYDDEKEYCRVSYRYMMEPDAYSYDSGFRLVAEFDPSNPFLIVSADGIDSVTLITSEGCVSFINLYVESIAPWTVSASVPWITYMADSDTLRVEISRNPDPQGRLGFLTIKAADQERVISIEQAPYVQNYLKVSTSLIDSVTLMKVPGVALEQELNVSSSGDWKVEKDITAQWISYSVDKKNNKIKLFFDKNTGEERSAWLTILCGDLEQEITINQKGYSAFSVETNEINFLSSGGEKRVKIYNNTSSGQCSCYALEDWCTPVISGTEIKITALENSNRSSRTSLVRVKCGNYEELIHINQEANNSTIFFDTDLMTFTASASTEYIGVYGVLEDWICSSDKTWCTVSKNGSQIKVTVTENTGSDRYATVKVNSADESQTFTVKQSAKPIALSVSPFSLMFDADGGSKIVTVSTNASSWSYSDVPSWCSVLKEANQLTIRASENSTPALRHGSIIFSAGGKTVTLSISQAKKEISLSISPSTLIFDADGGSQTVTVSTNASVWSYSDVPSWCSVSREGDQLKIKPVAYSGSGVRSGSIIISASGKTVTLSILQKEIIFSLSPSSLIFDVDGGSQTVTVSTNVSAWSYSDVPSWCSISRGPNQLTIRALANKGLNPRSGRILFSLEGERFYSIPVSQKGPGWNIGDYYSENGVKGVVWQVSNDGKSGKIVSLQEYTEQWSTSLGTTSTGDHYDGEKNMNNIRKISGWASSYPAFYRCHQQGGGWYLPADEELSDMFLTVVKNFGVSEFNLLLSKYGGDELSLATFYWSSTSDSDFARVVNSNIVNSVDLKSNINRVRAIRKVTFE